MSQSRLNDLTLLSIERLKTDNLDEEKVLELFYSKKRGRGGKMDG